ncbi:MAG TPA: two-component regulator propeller domain-containing protein, partial [Bacteroidia bacterium]|nr:two-component regulator propeller domain-containing protein [Bacteroidia bacterium]
METEKYPIKIILQVFFHLAIFFPYFSCSNNNTEKKIQQGIHDTLLPPVSVILADTMPPLPDTCLQPYRMIMPLKITNNTVNPKHAIQLLKLIPPEIKRAGFISQMHNYTTDNGLAMDIVSCAFTDKMGNLWFGTRGGGVSRYDGKSFTNFTTAQGLGHNFIWCITEDQAGNIWFGTNGGGASRYDGRCFTNFTTAQGLA